MDEQITVWPKPTKGPKTWEYVVALVVLMWVFGFAMGRVTSSHPSEHRAPGVPVTENAGIVSSDGSFSICRVNDPAYQPRDGHKWLQMQEADRDYMAEMARQGKIEVTFRPGSLICTHWAEGVPKLDEVGALTYWRPKLQDPQA